MNSCHNYDIRNRNGEMGLENLYDSAKIRIVGISVYVYVISTFACVVSYIVLFL